MAGVRGRNPTVLRLPTSFPRYHSSCIRMIRQNRGSIRADIWTQPKGTVILQLLVTVPRDRVAHTFHFNLSYNPQSLPSNSSGQYELRLPDLPGQRISRIEGPAYLDLAIVTRDRHSERSRHPCDSVVRKADHQPRRPILFIGPDERRPDAIPDPPSDLVNRLGILTVIIHDVLGLDMVKIPERPVIGAYVHHVSDFVVGVRNSLAYTKGPRGAVRHAYFHDSGNPGRRLLRDSICSFSTKIVSVRSQLELRTVRSTTSELPTRLKSGCVLVTRGVFVQYFRCVSNILIQVCSAVAWSGNGLLAKGHVCPSPQ